jgi:hypothetical protein
MVKEADIKGQKHEMFFTITTRVRPHFRFGSEIWNWSENFVSLGREKNAWFHMIHFDVKHQKSEAKMKVKKAKIKRKNRSETKIKRKKSEKKRKKVKKSEKKWKKRKKAKKYTWISLCFVSLQSKNYQSGAKRKILSEKKQKEAKKEKWNFIVK